MNKKIYGWYVVFINAFIGCVLSAGFPQSSMTIPYLSDVMNISQEALLLGDTIRTVGIIIAMLISGFVYQKIGAKKTFIVGMVLVIPALVATPYVKSLMLFYILKLIQGFGSIVFPVFLIIIMDWIEEKDHGLSTAIFNGVFYGGAGIGGTFSGYVIANFGWVESYWALGIVQLILAVIWLITIKENNTVKKDAAEQENESSVSFAQILKMPVTWLLVISFLSTTWSVQAISIDMPLFASSLGYGEMETGKILSAITIGIIAACIVSGKASDFFAGRSKNRGVARVLVLMVGCVIVVASVLMLITVDTTQFSLFYIAVLAFSFGASWGLGAFYAILPELFDKDALPVVTGFVGGIGDIGMTLAPVAVGIMFGIKGYWNTGWSLCIGIAILSIITCLMIVRQAKK